MILNNWFVIDLLWEFTLICHGYMFDLCALSCENLRPFAMVTCSLAAGMVSTVMQGPLTRCPIDRLNTEMEINGRSVETGIPLAC